MYNPLEGKDYTWYFFGIYIANWVMDYATYHHLRSNLKHRLKQWSFLKGLGTGVGFSRIFLIFLGGESLKVKFSIKCSVSCTKSKESPNQLLTCDLQGCSCHTSSRLLVLVDSQLET